MRAYFLRLTHIFVVASAMLAVGLLPQAAHAVLKVNITSGKVDPLPIAVYPFLTNQADHQAISDEMAEVIAADLERSGLFRAVPRRAFIETISSADQVPQFASWRQINAASLVTGAIEAASGDQITISFRLWDSYTETQIEGKSFTTARHNIRRIAHVIADTIYEKLTGEKGYFDTKITYISESGPLNKRVKRLAIMDQDGANHRYLTDGRYLVLTPRFSPNIHKLIFMSYQSRIPSVFVHDLDTGKVSKLGDWPGMTFAPRFAPNGTNAVMSASLDGNSEIFKVDLFSGKKQRLTQDPAIDTSPSFSPDERSIVFNSDRGGSQQLYVMNADGSNVRRISFGDGRYGSPAWSPRGDLIAFTKMTGGRFHIGVMKPDGSDERLLTESYLDESPTWSPNGRVIIFARQFPNRDAGNASSKLYSIDLTGYNEREIPTPLDASDPSWSALMH